MPFDPITGKWIPADPMGAAAGWDWGDLPPGSVGGEIYPSLLAERTMEEVASQFAADLPTDPRWRRGFRSMMPRLAGQYLLSSPYMQPMGAEGSPYGASFAQYLSDIGVILRYSGKGRRRLGRRLWQDRLAQDRLREILSAHCMRAYLAVTIPIIIRTRYWRLRHWHGSVLKRWVVGYIEECWDKQWIVPCGL